MSNQFCLVCLQNLAKGGDDDKKEEEDSTIRKIPILTLFQSLGRGRSKSSYQDEFAEEETCKLCPNCYPVLSEVEEIRNQIVLLEEQVVRKIGQVRDTISISASLKRGDDGDEKVKRIRKIILQVLGMLDFLFINFICKFMVSFCKNLCRFQFRFITIWGWRARLRLFHYSKSSEEAKGET